MKDKNQAKILAAALYGAAREKNKGELEKIRANFSAYLAKHGWQKLIPAVLLELENIYLAEQGIVRADVVSREKLSEPRLLQICDLVQSQSGRKVQLHSRLDNNLLGGIGGRDEDKIIDFIIKSQLKNLAKQL